MNNQRRNFRLTCALLAAVLAVGVAGCAQPAEDKQPQGKTQQLWIADNFVDPQEGYPMENPSAIELSATAALQKNSLLNGQTPKTAADPGDEGGLAILPRLEADAAGQK